jgi:predicted DNA-binding protein (MmcQ/YjbR family)
VDRARARRHCLARAGAVEEFPFGPQTAVFKVHGKVFALLPRRSAEPTISLKCEPALAEDLRAAHAGIVPGYHLNKRHWNSVSLDGGLPPTMIADLIEDSYDLVVANLPRRVRDALRAGVTTSPA